MTNTPSNDIPAVINTLETTEYMAALLLAECISIYGSAETLQAYDDSFKQAAAAKKKPTKAVGLLVSLSEAGAEDGSLDELQKKLLGELKTQVLELIGRGGLHPAGFKMPRLSTDKPVILSSEKFVSAQINWDKSEVIIDDINFAAIRLIEEPSQVIAKNKFDRAGNFVKEHKKSVKLDFARVKDDQYVTEKEAAHYLRISPRALQALRVNAKGPEWVKTGQAIRYKMADLSQWKEINDK